MVARLRYLSDPARCVNVYNYFISIIAFYRSFDSESTTNIIDICHIFHKFIFWLKQQIELLVDMESRLLPAANLTLIGHMQKPLDRYIKRFGSVLRPRGDSNTRPFAPQANALSAELRGQSGIILLHLHWRVNPIAKSCENLSHSRGKFHIARKFPKHILGRRLRAFS